MLLETANFRFGDFVLDMEDRALWKNGSVVPLPPKALKLLEVLVENRGRVVEKNDLMQRVWSDTFVEEGNLAYTVRLLRKILGDEANNPRFIETIPRRGYRFIFAVEAVSDRPTVHHVPGSLLSPDDAAEGPLIGRATEIGDVAGLFARTDVRLITLTGTGGTGKTRLARSIGRTIREQFPDGVFFIGLETVSDPSLVGTHIAHTLGVTEPGQRNVVEVLSDHFQGKSALLIIDNFEQVVTASHTIADLLRGTDGLKLLVTSREPLRLRVEKEYQVPPLAVPALDSGDSPLRLMKYEAVEFFIARARAVRPDFGALERDVWTVAAICRKLDGLPLALELAAARAKILSAAEILSKLENSLSLLTGGPRDVPGRQQTIRGAIMWSYELLGEAEKGVFARLAVFEGGFTYDAAERVLSIDFDHDVILEAVTSLCDKGLLVAYVEDGDQRFRMLVVVRELASELLRRCGSWESAGRSHAEYFMDLAELAEPDLQAPAASSSVKRLEIEHDNLRAAIRWSIVADPAIAARVSKALRHFWLLRGYTREAQHWFSEILRKDRVPSQHRWILLTGLANMMQARGDLAAALRVYRDSLDESRLVGNPKFIAQAMRGVAGAIYMSHDPGGAREVLEEALKISTEAGDEFGIAAAVARLGDIALYEGNFAEAQTCALDAIKIFRKLEYGSGVAGKLMNLGFAHVAEGSFESAREHLTESLSVATACGDYISTRLAIEGLSFVFFEAGDHRNAARLSAAAARMGDEIDHIIEPAEMNLRDRYVEKLKRAMGEARYSKAYSEGHRLSREQAAELAFGSAELTKPELRLVRKPRRS